MAQPLINDHFVYFVYDDKTAAIAECWKEPTGTLYIPAKVQEYTVTTILPKAFANKNLLEKVILPNTIQLVCEKAFQNCQHLRSVVAHKDAIIIQGEAFANCQALQTVNANQITLKGRGNFKGCKQLKFLTATFLLDIPPDAFQDCEKLTILTFQHATLLRHETSFSGCKSLIEMRFLGDGGFSDSLISLMQDITIACPENSILAGLAYEGFTIKII
jgi:hypothetical protein